MVPLDALREGCDNAVHTGSMKKFIPLQVDVIWDDARDEPGEWDLDDVIAGKGPQPKRNRSTGGRLCYVCEEYITLMHDWDADTRDVGNATTIFVGWIKLITHPRRGALYRR